MQHRKDKHSETSVLKKSPDVSKLKGVYFPEKKFWLYPKNKVAFNRLIKSIEDGIKYELIEVGGKRVKQVKK